MKTYYHTCPDCGAHLDPGERCTCWDPLWQIEVQMPDGDSIVTSIHGQKARIIDHYAAQGALVTRMVPVNA